MRDFNVFSVKRALPRMSWNRTNFFNLWRWQVGDMQEDMDFTRTRMTLFQQRWQSKKLVRAFHGDFIPEGAFKRWYLPKLLPDVRPRKPFVYDDELGRFGGSSKVLDAQDQMRRDEEDDEQEELPPTGSLMLTEVERRLDILIFRACLAASVYDARRFIVHGYVQLNGKKHTDANTRLAPGDMVSVDPDLLGWLKRHPRNVKAAAKNAARRREKAEKTQEALSRGPESFMNSSNDRPTSKSAYTEKTEGVSDPNNFGDPGDWEVGPGGLVEATVRTAPDGSKYSNVCRMPAYASPWLFVPAYLEVSYQTCSFVYVRHPTARPGYSEIATPFEADGEVIRLAWEWYVPRRPRMRSKRQLAREPLNRK